MTLKIWLYLHINCWFNHFSNPPSDKILPSHFVPHHAVVICEQQNMILMDQFAKVYFWTPLLINKDPPAPHHAPYTYEEHHPENLGAEAGLNRSLFLRQNPPNVRFIHIKSRCHGAHDRARTECLPRVLHVCQPETSLHGNIVELVQEPAFLPIYSKTILHKLKYTSHRCWLC